jgi:4-carboxymuconolactone decarboxylase
MTVTNKKLYDSGLKVRRAVLGAEYVDPQIELAKKDPVMGAIQDMVTEYCWGYGWTRPGLSKKTRSMLNLAMFVALAKPNELRAHVRGALRNGVTKKEIVEVLIQGTIYCGIPAGVDAFRNARAAMDEWDQQQRAGRRGKRKGRGKAKSTRAKTKK